MRVKPHQVCPERSRSETVGTGGRYLRSRSVYLDYSSDANSKIVLKLGSIVIEGRARCGISGTVADATGENAVAYRSSKGVAGVRNPYIAVKMASLEIQVVART